MLVKSTNLTEPCQKIFHMMISWNSEVSQWFVQNDCDENYGNDGSGNKDDNDDSDNVDSDDNDDNDDNGDNDDNLHGDVIQNGSLGDGDQVRNNFDLACIAETTFLGLGCFCVGQWVAV